MKFTTLFCCVLLLTACSSATSPNMTTYVNADHHFQMQYPKPWSKEEFKPQMPGLGDEGAQFVTDVGDARIGLTLKYKSLNTFPFNTPLAWDQFVDEERQRNFGIPEEEVSTLHIIKDEPDTVMGFPAHRFIYRYESKGFKLSRTTDLMLVHATETGAITLNYDIIQPIATTLQERESQYESFAPLFERMTQSIQITP